MTTEGMTQFPSQPVPHAVPGVGGVPALMQKDGIHPNAKAQPKLLDLAWPLIREASQKQASRKKPAL